MDQNSFSELINWTKIPVHQYSTPHVIMLKSPEYNGDAAIRQPTVNISNSK